jgi:hypothetical protein
MRKGEVGVDKTRFNRTIEKEFGDNREGCEAETDRDVGLKKENENLRSSQSTQ